MILLSQTGASEAERMPEMLLSSDVACTWGDDCGHGAKNGLAEPQLASAAVSPVIGDRLIDLCIFDSSMVYRVSKTPTPLPCHIVPKTG